MNTLKRLRKNTLFVYSLLFVFIAFLAFFWYIVSGMTLIYKGDGYLQHYSFIVKLRRFVADIVHGNGVSLWSWDTGYGVDTIGNFAIIFCDPFAYIAAAFKPKFIDIGYSISVILRLYAAGLAMIAFLRYRKKTSLQCLIGGIAYAFSSWAIMGGTRHAFFLNPLILFPLIVLGIDKIDKEKKPFVFVAAVFLSLITSFYFSYMSALLAITYLVIKYFLENENKKSIADFIKRVFKFVFYAVIAVMIAAPIFIPVFYTLIHANKTTGVDISFFMTLKQMFKYIPSFVSNSDINGNYSYTTLSMICLALVPAAIIDFRKKVNRLPSLMALICFVMAAFPIFGSVFNALSYSVGRWCYMLAFFFVWASVSALELDKFKDAEYRKAYKMILTIMVIVIVIVLLLGWIVFNVLSSELIYISLINLSFLLIFGFVICNNEKSRRISKSTALITLMIINLGSMYFVYHSPNFSRIKKYTHAGQSYKQYSSSAQRVGTKIQDDDFYRIDQVENSTSTGYSTSIHTPSNENIFFGTRSVYGYISTLDNRIFDYHKALCNSAGHVRRVCFYSNDNRSRMNFLQGVKYFIGNNKDKGLKTSKYAGYGYEEYKTVDGVKILKNNSEASLGYVFENTISESDFSKYDYLDREQIMMQACVISDDNKTGATRIDENNLALDSKKINYEIESQKRLIFEKNKINVTSGNSKLIISTGEIENSEVYVVFKNLKKNPGSGQSGDSNSKMKFNRDFIDDISKRYYGNFDIFIKKHKITKKLVNEDGDNQGFNDVKDYIANLGYYESTDGKISINFKTKGDYTYDSLEVIAVSQENFDAQAKTLENNRLKVSTLHDNYIKGTVNAENDGVLYLNIPYNDGWKVYIDGKEQETYVADIAFTGVDIEKGKHTVELKYRPVGFNLSLVISITGIALLVMILIYKKVKRDKC